MKFSVDTQWDGFIPGEWVGAIDVNDFIQHNVTSYEGDETFLEGPTAATQKLWDEVLDLFAKERENGGVLDMDTKLYPPLRPTAPVTLIRIWSRLSACRRTSR